MVQQSAHQKRNSLARCHAHSIQQERRTVHDGQLCAYYDTVEHSAKQDSRQRLAALASEGTDNQICQRTDNDIKDAQRGGQVCQCASEGVTIDCERVVYPPCSRRRTTNTRRTRTPKSKISFMEMPYFNHCMLSKRHNSGFFMPF